MNKATLTARPNEQNFTVERVFDAPREKVFAAMTEKDKLERWWTGPGYNNRVEHIDARNGGSWKFVQSDGKGNEFGFHGCFHEVSPERTIQTFEFDGYEPGHVSLVKMELTELPGGKTRLFSTTTFMSVADRDGMIKSGMEHGMNESYAALDRTLAEM